MDIKDVIKQFAAREIVPIDVQDDVVPIVNNSDKCELYFWPMDMDENIMRGNIVHWDYPNGDGIIQNCIDIHFCKSLSVDWQRLVCCKELVHLCDPIEVRVMTHGGLDKLIEKIVLPPEMTSISDGGSVLNDRVAIAHALAILFPWTCRQLMMTPFKEGLITIDQIAEMVDIPMEYAALVMDDGWHQIYHIITI